MSATTATVILVGAFVGFAATVWLGERVLLWLAAGRRPRADVARDAGGHVRRVTP